MPNAPAKKPLPREKQTKSDPGASEGWLLQCPPGLSEVLKKEMVFAGTIKRDQQLFIKKQRNHDLIFANHLKSPDGMERLRIAETILRCPVYGRYKISQRQLGLIAEEMKALGPRRLVVTVAGKVFQRHDLLRWMGKEISARGYEFSSDVEEEVWMFCIDEAWYFGVPVKKAREIEGRELRTEERQGSLPPPIAAALAFAGMPKDTDVVVDPVCGSGTLLAECRHYAAGAPLFGFDKDPKAIAIAKRNLAEVDHVNLVSCDSRKTNLAELGISLVLANLPFGLQFGEKLSNPDLYRDLIGEMWRLRDPEKPWRAILLTSDLESLQTSVQSFQHLALESLFKVKVRGELAFAYRLKPRK